MPCFPISTDIVLVAHLVEGREGLGMLDKDSPIWASDHFAVVSDFQLFLEK